MSNYAVRVESVSKRYRLGQEVQAYKTLRESLSAAFMGVFVQRRGRSGAVNGHRTIWALKDASFTVDTGEVLGVIGRNGAGKSTLLKILGRVTAPTEGEVRLNGRVGSLLEIGTGFHPELTGRENIFLNGAILGMHRSEIRGKFDQIVDFAEIEQFLDTPVKRYSSGMYMRLAFAVAAHLEPEILLVDEVLAVGDAAFQKKCFGKMGEVANSGQTILFVSHNMEAIQRICPKAILLDRGKVILLGPSREVVANYLDGIQSVDGNNVYYSPNSPFTSIGIKINHHAIEGVTTWKPSEKLTVSVTVESSQAVSCPRIDIAFYRGDALKLFAIRSDKFLDHASRDRKMTWTIDFEIIDATLAPQWIYFDLGVRQSSQGEYIVLWQRVCDVLVDTEGDGYKVTDDSILLPTIDVSVGNSG